MTQSAASAAIASLENIYQVKLFDRVGRSIELSETGQIFLPEAQNTLLSAMAATRNLRALSGKTHGRLHIAASQTIANYWLPQRLAIFHTRNPEVTLNVSMINTAAVEQAILEGAANIGFVEGKITSNKIELIEVDHDQPVMVASARSWLSFGMSNSVINLQKIPWIVREKGSGTRKMLEDFINQNGSTWNSSNIILELPSNESVREAVVAGAGATLISKHVVSLSIQTGLLKSSALNFPPRIYHMLVHKERPKTDAEKALVQFIHGTKHEAV
jgi:DNA-binding transcriptional LysR family regulator